MNESRVPLFPLSQPVFPDGLLQLTIFEVRYLHLIKRCQQEQIEFGVVALAGGREVQKAGEIEVLHDHGCLVRLIQVEALQPAVMEVVCIGTERFRLDEHTRGSLGLWAGSIRRLGPEQRVPVPTEFQSLANQLGALIASAQQQGLESRLPLRPPYRLDEAGWVADRWAELLPLPASDKTALLAQTDPAERLKIISKTLGPGPNIPA